MEKDAKEQQHWGESRTQPALASTCRADSAGPEGTQWNMRNSPSLQKMLRQVGSYEE